MDGEKIINFGQKEVSDCCIEGQYIGIFKIIPKKWIEIENYLRCLDEAILDRLDMTSLLHKVNYI